MRINVLGMIKYMINNICKPHSNRKKKKESKKKKYMEGSKNQGAVGANPPALNSSEIDIPFVHHN